MMTIFITNQQRIMSRNPNPIRELVRLHIMAGGVPGDFPGPHSREVINKIANSAGLRKYFLTEAEFATVLQQRKTGTK
jgi:hypothetical protein